MEYRGRHHARPVSMDALSKRHLGRRAPPLHVRELQRGRRDDQSRDLNGPREGSWSARVVERRVDRSDGWAMAVHGNTRLRETHRLGVHEAKDASVNDGSDAGMLVAFDIASFIASPSYKRRAVGK